VTLKLLTNEAAKSDQPSASANTTNLSGSENIMGETMTMPRDVKMLATAKSMAKKGK
jgi:hypothetical protein